MKNFSVVEKLIKNNFHISFAESLTGGLLSATLVDVPDASKVMDKSFVTYSDCAKMEILGVKKETLDQFTVYSSEVAKEMCMGLSSDIAVSTTGIAGPTGGTKKNPVGTVYVGIKLLDKVYSYKCFFSGSRNEIRAKTVEFVFDKLDELIK